MFIRKLQLLRERGDTIVEVLIAVAVISMVLGGAYVTTNRNLRTSRTTEEQSSGLKLAESQVEQIKGLISRDPGQVFDSPYGNFCIYKDEVIGSSDSRCKVDVTGEETTGQPQYSLSSSESNNTFTVRVQWDNLSGGQSNVRMLYRIHE